MASTALPDSPEYIGWRLEIFTAFFVPLQIAAVGLRYYTRWLIQGPWGWDDVIVMVSLAFQMIMAGIGIGAVKEGGMGYHELYLKETNPAILITWGKYLTAISTLYFFIVNVPKLAILALYHRLFPGPLTHAAIYLLATILIGASVANTVAALAACRPYAANWDPTLPGAHCIDKEPLFIWSSLPNIVTDVAMLVLPLPLIWGLHASRRLKGGLTVTFLVGSFGMVTSVLRFASFFRTSSFADGTYAAVELMMWTQTEPGMYLISACLPTYRPLLERAGVGRLAAAVRSRSGKGSAYDSRYGKRSKGATAAAEMGVGRPWRAEGSAGGAWFHKPDDSLSSRDDSTHEGAIVMRTEVKVESE